MKYWKKGLLFGLLLVFSTVWGQRDTSLAFSDTLGGRPLCVTPAQDSLLQYLIKNKNGLQTAIEVFNWKQLLLTLVGFLFFVGVAWRLWIKDWLKKYIQKKAEEALDEISSLKSANILVLTSKSGKDDFLRTFFKAKKFPNVKFERLGDDFKAPDGFDYDVVFANNDDGELDKSLVRKYVADEQPLFYFGKPNTWDYQNDTPELSRKINFANSRAQIYGNFMSSLEFLELVNPKIKNV